jgi:hypothetical protein
MKMPNWCKNDVFIDAEREVLAEVQRLLNYEGKIVSFDGFAPTPEGSDWYSWQIENWGTKWGPVNPEVIEEGDRLVYAFDSAWAPPIGAFVKLTELFPVVVTIAYDEPGSDEGGWVLLKEGITVDEHHGSSRMNTWADDAYYQSEFHELLPHLLTDNKE